MKKHSNIWMRTAALLLALAITTTSLAFAQAKYTSKIADGATFYMWRSAAATAYSTGGAQTLSLKEGWWGFVMRGGQGGRRFWSNTSGTNDNGEAGAGGVVRGMFYHAGGTLYIWVGQFGGSGTNNIDGRAGGVKIYGSGRSAGSDATAWFGGSDGGGASIIATGSPPTHGNCIAIAAGGGGGGGANNNPDHSRGGDGGSILTPNSGAITTANGTCGGSVRTSATANTTGNNRYAGQGGTGSGGGAGGMSAPAWAAGSALAGGSDYGSGGSTGWGGGGGGGYYGGGGGCKVGGDNAGGGGGSSFTSAAVYPMPTTGVYARVFATLDVATYTTANRRGQRGSATGTAQEGVIAMVYMGLSQPAAGTQGY